MKNISAGSVGLSAATGLVSAVESGPARYEQRQASEAEIEEFLSQTLVDDFISSLRVPRSEISRENSTVKISRNDQGPLLKTISVETTYGTVSAVLGEPAKRCFFDPTFENIPKGLRKQYAGTVGWESDSDARMVASTESESISFVRESTAEERSAAMETADVNPKNKISVSVLSSSDVSGSTGRPVRMNRDGEVWVQTKQDTHQIDYESGDVTEVIPTQSIFVGKKASGSGTISTSGTGDMSLECQEQAIACGVDLILNVQGCTLAMLGCGSMTAVTAGTLALGCELIAIHLCALPAGVSIYSCFFLNEECPNIPHVDV
jgi:hypothetical protein